MPIYTIAQYKVRTQGIEKVKQAIQEFVPYVKAHEPGTKMYLAWQEQNDPTRFVHFSFSRMKQLTRRMVNRTR